MGKDFRYYFQHPWSRMIVAYLVIFFNFLIFAEDPVSHSQTEANVIVVGNCFSFVTNKYPRGVGWRILKVLLWLLAILIGLIAGKFLFHQRLFGKYPKYRVSSCCWLLPCWSLLQGRNWLWPSGVWFPLLVWLMMVKSRDIYPADTHLSHTTH